MACPVNHPFFHALVFLLGVIVVLSRYARAETVTNTGGALSLALSAVPALSNGVHHMDILGQRLS
jgi:hypothetical protein